MINFKKPTQPTTNKHKTNRGKKAPPLPPPPQLEKGKMKYYLTIVS